MNILVTGAEGFVGKNLVENLKTIKQGKNKKYSFPIKEIFEYDIHTSPDLLDTFCLKADFVFHLAGVNRPKNREEFIQGNCDFSNTLLTTLKKYSNTCPLMLSSSIQASLINQYSNSDYGKSKLAGEQLFFDYEKETGAKVFVYRFPNLFGKWCRPNYNSVVATFCYNIAHDLPIQINNAATELEFLYIDDLIDGLLDSLNGNINRCDYQGLTLLPSEHGQYCYIPTTHKVTLGELADLLYCFKSQSESLILPELKTNSFAKKLYSTYLSYLPKEKVCFPLKMNIDRRGSFTELLKTDAHGQFSVNISEPGVTKGQHWHNSKWEFFIVVAGHGLIQERRIGTDEHGNPYPVIEFEVSGDKIEAVHMLPGYTHNIINLSKTEKLITFMWANELFQPEYPDTYYEEVEKE